MTLKNMFKLKSHHFIILMVIGLLSCDDDDIREVTLFDKGTAEATASTTSIEFGQTVDFSSTSTKVQSSIWTFAGGSPATSTDADVTVTYNSPGTFVAKLDVKYIDNQTDSKSFTIVVAGPDEPIPYGGTPAAIPGTIEVENYDIGGQGVAYSDAEEENLAESAGSAIYRDDDGVDIQVSGDGSVINIGYTGQGEWSNYTVDVAAAGSYDFEFLVGSDPGGFSVILQKLNLDTGAVTDLGATGDFSSTGGWGVYTGIMVEGVFLEAGKQTLRMYFTGGNTNIDKINVTQAAGSGGGGAGPYKVAIASQGIANTDIDYGYVTALENAGYIVEAITDKYKNLDAAGAAQLNTFDLVIITRNTNSADYGSDATVRANWMSVSTPVLIMSSYIARNNRLQLFNTDVFNDNGGLTVNAIVETHPVFSNITLTAGNTGDIASSALNVIASADPGNGTLIGTDGTNAAIAEWDANTEFYAGSSMAAGKRMYMAGTGGGYTFNEIGNQLLLNVCEYLTTGAVGSGSGGATGETLGFYTERSTTETVTSERPPANSGNFNISYVTDAAEGSEAIYANFATAGTGNDVTWGAMVSMYPEGRGNLDVSAYNYYHISLKAPAENTNAIRLRLRTGGGNFWVTLTTETEGAYGLARDGQWHDLKIPLSDLLLDGTGAPLDAGRASITEVIFRSDVDAAALGTNFDWFIDDLYFSK